MVTVILLTESPRLAIFVQICLVHATLVTQKILTLEMFHQAQPNCIFDGSSIMVVRLSTIQSFRQRWNLIISHIIVGCSRHRTHTNSRT